MEAIGRAHAVLVKKENSPDTFPVDSELTIAFYSYSSPRYTHVHEVERVDNRIDIRFLLVPHQTKNMTKHLALIPLGKLSEGQYQVNMVKLPLGERYLNWGIQPVSTENAEKWCAIHSRLQSSKNAGGHCHRQRKLSSSMGECHACFEENMYW